MTIGDARLRSPVTAGIRDRILAIRSLGIFAEVDDDGARLLTEHARLNSFPAGATVRGLEGNVESIHIVLEGKIEITDGQRGTFPIGPGRPVGLIRLLSKATGGPRATALVPTRTFEIPGDVFLAALEENFSLWRGAIRMITSTLLDARGPLPPAGDAGPPVRVDERRPRTLVERAMEISTAGIFTEANVDAVFDVARILREVHVPAGHVFWRRTEPARAAIRVVSGAVRCTDESGKSVVAGPEFMLGTIAASAQRSYGYEARAETDVSAYEVAFEDWLIVVEAHPELAMRLLSVMAAQLAIALGARPSEPPPIPVPKGI